ncbi:MAG: hypothetical protein JXR12_06420 [Neptunomonas phycophila]|uniref:hypothetical protein n=1 Tax=Neptunomonas phycophila TaxID=1572645 RepID=UPI003B8B96BB
MTQKRLFNTEDLVLPFGHQNKNRLRVPQKKTPVMNKYLLMPLDEHGSEMAMIYLSRKQLQQLHRHIGGMLGLEDNG